MSTDREFGPELFAFLRELKANNDREWFNANKDRYENDLLEPALAFIEDFGLRLPQLSPHLVADARRQGGSLFRIYRDTRFARDKSPYKTQAGIYFRHERSKDAHSPGLYLHPEGESLKRVPPAFPKDHVHADDLRRKDFAAIARFTQKEATTEGFLDRYEAACRSFTPLMKFLCRAVGVPY